MKKHPHISDSELVTNIDEWIAWLRGQRSRVSQTTGTLRKNKSFCCLGVAADKVLHLKKTHDDDGHYTFITADGNKIFADLDHNTYNDLGLRAADGSAHPAVWTSTQTSWFESLVDLNDNGVRFKRIAEILEVDLRTGLFGYFVPRARIAWLRHYGFKLHREEFTIWKTGPWLESFYLNTAGDIQWDT